MTIETLKAIYSGNINYLNEIDFKGKLSDYLSPIEKWNWLHKALMSVMKTPPVESIAKLIDLGVSTNALDIYGNSPLHYAARLKSLTLASALLDGGANINQLNFKGVSPLRESLLKKPFSRELIKLFLTRGADVNLKNSSGSTDIDYIRLISHGADADIIEILEK